LQIYYKWGDLDQRLVRSNNLININYTSYIESIIVDLYIARYSYSNIGTAPPVTGYNNIGLDIYKLHETACLFIIYQSLRHVRLPRWWEASRSSYPTVNHS